MEFLVQTEQKLAVEISGNYQHLLEQQRAHEVSDGVDLGAVTQAFGRCCRVPCGGLQGLNLGVSLLKCTHRFCLLCCDGLIPKL